MRRGRKKGQNRVDIDAMMVNALLLERVYGMRPGAAARTAIRAFFTLADNPRPEARIDLHERAVKKAVQRFKDGKRDLSPEMRLILCVVHKATGKPFTGTPEELAAAAHEFLAGEAPKGGRPKKASPSPQEITERLGERWIAHFSEGPGAARAWLVNQLAEEHEVDERTAQRWVEQVCGDKFKRRNAKPS